MAWPTIRRSERHRAPAAWGGPSWSGPTGASGAPDRGMRLSFHQRILLLLIRLGAVPTALAILGWGLTIRSTARAPGARDAIEGVTESGRLLLHTVDSTRLPPAERQALADHAATPTPAVGQFQRADAFSRYYYAGLGLVIFLLGAAFIYASIRFGGHLSRQLSRPIEELIGRTGNISP